ncbi:MAG: subtype B tannase [Candidatus Coproplasma sp.]
MNKKFKTVALAALAVCTSLSFTATACGDNGGSGETQKNNGINADGSYSLEFCDQVESWQSASNAKYGVSYYTASAVYCANPTNPGNQSLALYVPDAYINDDGTVNRTAKVGNYTAATAPIIYWNSHGSYIGMGPFTIAGNSTRSTNYGWVINILKEGMVICMVGERGKTSVDADGNVVGRGPVAVSDLKAGVRFLRHNKDDIPGDTERIISVGTSSGGATSALLGASGNCSYYDTYLQEMGAVMDERDDVYATQAYCPITDFDHADYAYEWMFWQDDAELTDFQKALSEKFRVEYASYINGLELTDGEGNALTLAEDGTKSGTYYDWLLTKYEESFEHYIQNYETDYKGYSTEKGNGAEFLDQYDWITYDQATGKAEMVTPEGYDSALDALVLTYRARQKTCPSFDRLEPAGTDNDVFGPQGPKAGSEEGARHFNQRIAEMIEELKDEFPEEYNLYYQAYYDDSHVEEVEDWVVYLNAYSFVTGAAESDVSPNFRINMGAHDADTSITVSATLALLLEKSGVNTEFNILWDWGHNDVDTPTGLCDWVKSICK